MGMNVAGAGVLRAAVMAIALGAAAWLAAAAPEAAAAAAVLERPDTPMSVLQQAPYQLEVTVLSVEHKEAHQGTSVWHRVRVERVMVGAGLKPGDETAVVSSTYRLAPGTVGSSGDRGLPRKGDVVRVYAGGTATTLQSVSPNGWQPLERRVALLGADERAGAERTMPRLAALLKESGAAQGTALLAAAGDGRGSAGTKLAPGGKAFFTEDWLLRRVDATVLCATGLTPDHNTALGLGDALHGGLPLVALRRSTATYAPEAELRRRGGAAPREFGREVFGAVAGEEAPAGTRTRVIAPTADAAAHPILAGVTIPAEGLVVPSRALAVEGLAEDCRVLLWGEPVGPDGAAAGPRRPVLWWRERAREAERGSGAARVKVALPPQRVAVLTLGDEADFDEAAVGRIAVRMVAWAVGEDERMNDVVKKKVK